MLELDEQGRVRINENLTIYDIELEKNELTYSAEYNDEVYTDKQVKDIVEKIFNELIPDAVQKEAFLKAHN